MLSLEDCCYPSGNGSDDHTCVCVDGVQYGVEAQVNGGEVMMIVTNRRAEREGGAGERHRTYKRNGGETESAGHHSDEEAGQRAQMGFPPPPPSLASSSLPRCRALWGGHTRVAMVVKAKAVPVGTRREQEGHQRHACPRDCGERAA